MAQTFLQWVDLQMASPGPNALQIGNNANGGLKPLPSTGYMNSVQVDIPGGVPRGRYYAVVEVLRPQAAMTISVVGRVWAGYIYRGAQISILPFPLAAGLQLRVRVAAGTNAVATDTIYVTAGIWTDPVAASSIFWEAPGSGPGEFWSKTPPGPTPQGSNPATFTVPNQVRWRIHGWGASLVCSAVAANRLAIVAVQDPAGVEFGGGCAWLLAVASQTVTYRAGIGSVGGSPSQNIAAPQTPFTISLGLADLTLFPGCIIEVITRGLDTNGSTGDQWSGARFEIEEWAAFDP